MTFLCESRGGGAVVGYFDFRDTNDREFLGSLNFAGFGIELTHFIMCAHGEYLHVYSSEPFARVIEYRVTASTKKWRGCQRLCIPLGRRIGYPGRKRKFCDIPF